MDCNFVASLVWASWYWAIICDTGNAETGMFWYLGPGLGMFAVPTVVYCMILFFFHKKKKCFSFVMKKDTQIQPLISHEAARQRRYVAIIASAHRYRNHRFFYAVPLLPVDSLQEQEVHLGRLFFRFGISVDLWRFTFFIAESEPVRWVDCPNYQNVHHGQHLSCAVHCIYQRHVWAH